MINRIEQLLAEIEAFAPQTAADVEAFRIKILKYSITKLKYIK